MKNKLSENMASNAIKELNFATVLEIKIRKMVERNRNEKIKGQEGMLNLQIYYCHTRANTCIHQIELYPFHLSWNSIKNQYIKGGSNLWN